MSTKNSDLKMTLDEILLIFYITAEIFWFAVNKSPQRAVADPKTDRDTSGFKGRDGEWTSLRDSTPCRPKLSPFVLF